MLSVLRAMCDTPTIGGRLTSLFLLTGTCAEATKRKVVPRNKTPALSGKFMIPGCCAARAGMSSSLKKSVVKLYMHLTGGVDSGLNEIDVLNYWRQNKVSGDKIVNYVSIDPKNHTHVQQAITLFGGVYLGFQVQQNCVQEFDAQQPWTPGPLTNDGHAVFAVGYDQNGVTVLTWGNTQQGTWAWWDECVDEAYAILSPETEQAGFAPGFNFAQLEADIN